MKHVQEANRRGPWSEQEDILLINFVRLFGDRRWDFVAKVSGLNRTGKSCRLRWVNYLNPGLKRGKMTPQEESLVLELHGKWGNRWSKIALKLPGRTDNEIKNYWRTYMRKKSQEKKCLMSPSSSSSSITTTTTQETVRSSVKVNQEREEGYYSMDDIWREIDQCGENVIKPVKDTYYSEQYLNFPLMESNMDVNESKMSSFAIDECLHSFDQHGGSFWSSCFPE
ncbi:unnamed protein product [Cochlearia groenlandica]